MAREDFYGVAWVVDVDTALATARVDQDRMFFVPIPADDTQARALRSAGYAASAYFPEWYSRNLPRTPDRPNGRACLRAYLAQRDGPGCYYCGSPDATTLDHVIPRSRGGSWAADNMVLACVPCNLDKCNRTPEEWRAGVIYHRRHCKTDAERAWFDALPALPAVPRIHGEPIVKPA